MDERNNVPNSGTGSQGNQPSEDDKLKGYKYVDTTMESAPENVDKFAKSGKVFTLDLDDSNLTKSGNKATVTDNLVRVSGKNGMILSRQDDGYVLTLPDGTEQKITGEAAEQLIKNGVDGGDFVHVEGVRRLTEHEKIEKKPTRDKLKAIAAGLLVGAVLLGIPIGLKGCDGETKDQDTPIPPEPDKETETVYEDESIEEALTIIYGSMYSEIQELLDPATVVRTAQDAYEAIDYDMELMGGDLCRYAAIQEEIVNPGAEFVEEVSSFRESYDASTLDSSSFREMAEAAKPLLERQGKWINTASGLVRKHADTTQECIDRGLRVEDYTEEKKITLGQLGELQSRKEKLGILSATLAEVDRIEQGLRDGTITCNVSPEGKVMLFEGDTFMMFGNNSTAKTQENTVTETIGTTK